MEKQIETHSPFAVITGASSGIGFELARVFSENGFDLLIVAEDAGLIEAAARVGGRGNVDYLQVDLATDDGVDRLYEKILATGRPVDALALNAGVGSGGEFISTSLEKEENLIRLNVMSVVRLSKKVLPDMVKRRQGKILFTSSIAAETPGPFEAVYAASKAFVQSFAMALRQEVEEYGITITALQPGVTDTNFFARANMLDTPAGEGEKDSPRLVAEQGFEAMMKGEEDIIAGSFMNKVNVAGTKLMSEKQGAKIQARSAKPKSIQH
jgi:short-subunit dehydrogenase